MTNWMPDATLLSRPVFLSLAEQFARAIETGTLAAGLRLLPQRRLADRLGISVQTVSRAYEELIRRGLVFAEVGRGSFVAPSSVEARQPYLPERPFATIDLSILKPVVGEMHLARMREGFSWLAEHLTSSSALSFRPEMVMPQHRVVAADWLARQGIEVDPGAILLTNGATPALTAAIMGTVSPGGGLAVEALTHHTLMPLCAYLGLHIEGLAMDEHGMIPAALDEAARRGAIRAVYLQPDVINPLACQMPEPRRRDLVDVARRHDLAIIENDILNIMIPERPRAFATLAPERTLHICGFSKITLPGMRLAYLSAPARFVTAVANRHLVVNWMATPPMADLLSHWIVDGTVTELALWQRGAIAARHAVASEVLGPVMPVCHPLSLHLWLPLPKGWTEESFVQQARHQGVAIASGGAFRASVRWRQEAVRISLGSTREAELRRGLGIVAAMMETTPEVLLPGI